MATRAQAKVLVALGVTSLALIAAVPANAGFTMKAPPSSADGGGDWMDMAELKV